ncbi:MAG TPA: histone deacetylase [Bryobacteraceae bacterium]|jgi:acetoin utilization deacetylase AcuC-like enzyme|nr:histone deacetylase [Bryobacteraceae bacterium]
MHRTAITGDPIVKLHDTGPGHPEQPARYSAVMDRLAYVGLLDVLEPLEWRRATPDELALVHTREYLELVEREIDEDRRQLSTGDTVISSSSLEPAQVAVGCVLTAVDAVFSKTAANAFCAIRPPGHHAGAGRGMGFCLYNNIAVAARYAQRRHHAERVLIADWDVHHGNGTQDIFYEDGSVFFFSTHQSPWYPGTGSSSERGEGSGLNTTLNFPSPAGSGRAEILGAFEQHLVPVAERFRPDLILISAGFDSRVGDPLGLFTLTDTDFADLTRLMMGLADRYCEGRLVSVLEGGYNLDGLARAAESHVRQLLA